MESIPTVQMVVVLQIVVLHKQKNHRSDRSHNGDRKANTSFHHNADRSYDYSQNSSELENCI
jgi:hypothetical protein